MRRFLSDNNAGLCPEALAALVETNDGSHYIGYGDDDHTERAVQAFRDLFGADVMVFFVPTGTAANVLALSALTRPWQRIVCHRHAHCIDDESTAPERFTQCRMTSVGSDAAKVLPSDVEEVLGELRGDVHQPGAGAVTISNATELGTIYTPAEVAALAEVAHRGGFRLHVDGARFANAVAALGCEPRALTIDAGVDALSFGGTKNGLAFGDAVVLFPQGDGSAFRRATEELPHHRKSSGHLLSKHRFLAAPFGATLASGAWLRHAAHANAMARRLAEGLTALGVPPAFPVEANGVFVPLGETVLAAMAGHDHGAYPFGDRTQGLSRLMCSFDTTVEDVDRLLAIVRSATSG